MVGTDIAIDLGTANFRLFMDGRGVLVNEPNVIAVDTYEDKIVAIGQSAQEMMGKTSARIRVVKPMAGGVISDFSLMDATIRHYLKQVMTSRVFTPRVVVTVPSGITEVERRAVVDAIAANGVRKICLLEAPAAAAIGAGIDITRPHGTMIVVLGEGVSDAGVISMNGLSASRSVAAAGASFNEAIIKYARKHFDLVIGDRTAEAAKRAAGCASPMKQMKSFDLKGRDLQSGLPTKVTVTSDQLCEAIKEPAMRVVRMIQTALEETPPELMADIGNEGILLAGGSAHLSGLDTLIAQMTRMRVRVLEDAENCVILGAGRAVQWIDKAKYDPKNGNRTTPLTAYY
ncbi:rod shape-determining protein [Anaeromassilibacillus senegalensis]|uniref:Cell shape-determining protein MreB n=1 Tax=Anaeromassilibacillus senegalensis TaxID=1673717 RepID=A0ABS9CQ10_9FIRM|nr:rod shape-determining protein [Anaeromassilibacillus senegalensis]MCF2652054.1 rod shape-determining protein [Anaeromassilibacillus senegalensis]MCI5650725.1 rod shape-determining protein [Ruminococcus bromii]